MEAVEYRGRTAAIDPETLDFHAISRDRRSTGRSGNQPAVRPTADTAATRSLQELVASRRELERLVLNVANMCNLDCVYCYAQGGAYGGPQTRMTATRGEQALGRFLRDYDEVSAIQFFGGEPLLNMPVIEHLCDFGWRLADELGRPRPVYTLSTNGTILNAAVVELISSYDIKVTVSLDGPPDVVDRLRPARNSGPTARRVEANIKAMREATGQPVQVEGTYTSIHQALAITPGDVLKYVHQEFGIALVHMPVNALPENTPLRDNPHAVAPEHMAEVADAYAATTADVVQHLLHRPPGDVALLSTALNIIEELVRPQENARFAICPAGSGTIAVDVNGTTYPCFMFYRQPNMALGHVSSGAIIPPVIPSRQLEFVATMTPNAASTRLQNSWARRFFSGCAGANYFRSGDHGRVSDVDVDLVEAMTAAAVVELAFAVDEDPDRVGYLPIALDLFKSFIGAPASG